MENKYNRVITSSLLALRRLLTTLPASQVEGLTTQVNQLLADSKLWKHGKSPITSVSRFTCSISSVQALL